MTRIIEKLYHWAIQLGRALGLVKGPLPTPPQIPMPDIVTYQPSIGDPLLFYGPFIPQWGSFEFREMVTFDFRYQVHGCGPTGQKYGIKNPLKNGVTFNLTVLNNQNGVQETVFTFDGANVSDLPVCVDRLYWIPGYSDATRPPQFLPKRNRALNCIRPNKPESSTPSNTEKYTLTLRVHAPNGQGWGWTQTVVVAGNTCK